MTLETDIGLIGRNNARGMRLNKTFMNAAVTSPQVKDNLTRNFNERQKNLGKNRLLSTEDSIVMSCRTHKDRFNTVNKETNGD